LIDLKQEEAEKAEMKFSVDRQMGSWVRIVVEGQKTIGPRSGGLKSAVKHLPRSGLFGKVEVERSTDEKLARTHGVVQRKFAAARRFFDGGF